MTNNKYLSATRMIGCVLISFAALTLGAVLEACRFAMHLMIISAVENGNGSGLVQSFKELWPFLMVVL